MTNWIIFYLIGCILGYFRTYAHYYEIEEKYARIVKPQDPFKEVLFISLASWFTFAVGITFYFLNKDKYFFKSNIKTALEIYNKYNT